MTEQVCVAALFPPLNFLAPRLCAKNRWGTVWFDGWEAPGRSGGGGAGPDRICPEGRKRTWFSGWRAEGVVQGGSHLLSRRAAVLCFWDLAAFWVLCADFLREVVRFPCVRCLSEGVLGGGAGRGARNYRDFETLYRILSLKNWWTSELIRWNIFFLRLKRWFWGFVGNLVWSMTVQSSWFILYRIYIYINAEAKENKGMIVW